MKNIMEQKPIPRGAPGGAGAYGNSRQPFIASNSQALGGRAMLPLNTVLDAAGIKNSQSNDLTMGGIGSYPASSLQQQQFETDI